MKVSLIYIKEIKELEKDYEKNIKMNILKFMQPNLLEYLLPLG